jgi:uncharacterized protein (TIGR02246 family)
MSPEQDAQQIRDLIAAWLRASAADDLATVLSLMAEDVVFLLPGRSPMRGRAAYAEASRSMMGKLRIAGTPEVQEVQIFGDYAYCWNFLTITMTPVEGGAPMQRAGDVLSIFRREPDGRWVLFRDANLLTAVEA